MSNTINTSVSVGKLNFTFTDEDGNAFSSFRMNPADFSIAARCSEVSEYFSKHEDISGESIEGVLLFNKELEEKFAISWVMMQEIVFWGGFGCNGSPEWRLVCNGCFGYNRKNCQV